MSIAKIIEEITKDNDKIVIKIGSNTITNENGTINREFMAGLARQVSELKSRGLKVVIVSSGARIAGVGTLGKWSRKEDIHYKQALCAIGQVELMDAYRRIFGELGLHIGQLLLTKDDFESETRILNIRNTLYTLVDEGIVPIVNENDTVCVQEIKIGDNDMMGAYTAGLWSAGLLVILSDVEGVYNKNPKDHEDAEMIEVIEDIEAVERSISMDSKSSFGTGGMVTKFKAAKAVTSRGAALIIAKGNEENIVVDLIDGRAKGSIFLPNL